MLGGFHFDMAFQKMIGSWLQGCGWEKAITQTGIATAGPAESWPRKRLTMHTRIIKKKLIHLKIGARVKWKQYHNSNFGLLC